MVPGDRSSGQRCIRCQTPFASSTSKDIPIPAGIEPLSLLTEQSTVESLLQPPLPQADWQLEAELRYVERLAMAWKQAPPINESTASPGELPSDELESHSRERTQAVPAAISSSPPRFAGLAWATLSIGVMCFVCGGVLLGWSALTGRQSLWSLGLPLTLIGQAGLILGLVLQLETLWQTNRATSNTLDQLDGELNELRHSTTLLTQSHSNPSQSFYLHMAEGASPHLLLADLKGQLDLLSQQMSKRR